MVFPVLDTFCKLFVQDSLLKSDVGADILQD